MNQPELGKKIAELRKAKGLTQEELVEKCNLNVRTLQRIESGEVTPRSYTIKVIFAALDYNYNNLIENKPRGFTNSEFIITKWLEQFIRYFFDLFNLKTNTMKKIIILTAMLAATFLILFIKCSESKSQKIININKAFKEQNKLSMKWFNNGHVDSLVSLYSKKACIYRYNTQPICGRDNIGELIQTVINQNSYKIIDMSTLSLKVIDSIAIEKSIVTVRYNCGEITRSVMLQEWHLINRKWLIQNDISVLIK